MVLYWANLAEGRCHNFIHFRSLYFHFTDGQPAFLGASDSDIENQWKWAESGRYLVDTFANWHSAQPQIDTAQNCFYVNGGNSLFWFVTACSNRALAVCEYYMP